VIVEARLGSGDGESFEFVANGFHAEYSCERLPMSWKNSLFKLPARCNEYVTQA